VRELAFSIIVSSLNYLFICQFICFALAAFGSIWQHLAAFGYPIEQSTSEGFFVEQ